MPPPGRPLEQPPLGPSPDDARRRPAPTVDEIHEISFAVDDDASAESVEIFEISGVENDELPRFQALTELPPTEDVVPSTRNLGGAAIIAAPGESRSVPWHNRGAATTVPTPTPITRVPTPPSPVDPIPPPASTRRRQRVPQPPVRARGIRRLGCGGRPAAKPTSTATRDGPSDESDKPAPASRWPCTEHLREAARHLRQRGVTE